MLTIHHIMKKFLREYLALPDCHFFPEAGKGSPMGCGGSKALAAVDNPPPPPPTKPVAPPSVTAAVVPSAAEKPAKPSQATTAAVAAAPPATESVSPASVAPSKQDPPVVLQESPPEPAVPSVAASEAAADASGEKAESAQAEAAKADTGALAVGGQSAEENRSAEANRFAEAQQAQVGAADEGTGEAADGGSGRLAGEGGESEAEQSGRVAEAGEGQEHGFSSRRSEDDDSRSSHQRLREGEEGEEGEEGVSAEAAAAAETDVAQDTSASVAAVGDAAEARASTDGLPAAGEAAGGAAAPEAAPTEAADGPGPTADGNTGSGESSSADVNARGSVSSGSGGAVNPRGGIISGSKSGGIVSEARESSAAAGGGTGTANLPQTSNSAGSGGAGGSAFLAHNAISRSLSHERHRGHTPPLPPHHRLSTSSPLQQGPNQHNQNQHQQEHSQPSSHSQEQAAAAAAAAPVSTSSSMPRMPAITQQNAGKLRVFSYTELRAATGGFSRENLLGEGGFGGVYKGHVDAWPIDGVPIVMGQKIVVAVKRLNKDGLQGHKEWLAEVNFLGNIQHPRLVRLLGYCAEEEHRLLVYEFVPNKSLEDHLFKSNTAKGGPGLAWLDRIKIALDAAKGLAYLHDETENQVIFRDFKAANILLDNDLHAKLSDFGLARAGPEGDRTHVSTQVVGTVGYAAPEYVLTGHLTARSDVWSYGVVLVELLTGRRALDESRPREEVFLVDWAKPYLAETRRLFRIMDPGFEGKYSAKASQKVAALALWCLAKNQKQRPTMTQVVESLTPLLDLTDNAGLSASPAPITPLRVPPASPMGFLNPGAGGGGPGTPGGGGLGGGGLGTPGALGALAMRRAAGPPSPAGVGPFPPAQFNSLNPPPNARFSPRPPQLPVGKQQYTSPLVAALRVKERQHQQLCLPPRTLLSAEVLPPTLPPKQNSEAMANAQRVSWILLLLVSFLLSALPNAHGFWVTHGGDLLNRRWANTEQQISPSSASQLALSWEFTTRGDVSATPAVFGDFVYFPDAAGYLYAVRRSTGATVWQKRIRTDYGIDQDNFQGRDPYSRATPVVAEASGFLGNLLIISVYGPAYVLAVRRSDGGLVWKTLLDPHPAAVVTGSGTAYRNGLYVGVSSGEEVFASDPTYPCCTFIGSVVKLNIVSGAKVWQTYTLPPNGGNASLYAGAAVWGANPSIDEARELVFVATGNNYRVPDYVSQCQQEQEENGATIPDKCIEPGNYFDSILAIDLLSGSVQWATNLSPIDAWNIACITETPSPNCPPSPGEDYDFGMAPLLMSIDTNTAKENGQQKEEKRDIAVAGQKSGIIWALDRDDGSIVWSTAAGPGGLLGGASWGISTDLERIYVGILNSDFKEFTLLPSATVTYGSAWIALNPATGAVLWSTANPNAPALAMLPSAANGVVFAASMDTEGHVYAFDAASGQILWSFTPGASVYGGISVDRGCIYFGRGYNFPFLPYATGGGPQRVYAFCVPHGV
ncbi:unnamed protein product [Closterium sp. Yama58-4]|nr:unnamed protein product [Closterium sp. Yama58-4]